MGNAVNFHSENCLLRLPQEGICSECRETQTLAGAEFVTGCAMGILKSTCFSEPLAIPPKVGMVLNETANILQ